MMQNVSSASVVIGALRVNIVYKLHDFKTTKMHISLGIYMVLSVQR